MQPRLPDYVDPWRFADAGKHLSGSLDLAQMPRLRESVLDEEGEVRVELAFGRDPSRCRYVTGRIRCRVHMQCQRCLDDMMLEIDIQVALSPVENEGAAECLPEQYDPLVAGDARIKLVELVEDELLLVLPQVPAHPEQSCAARLGAGGEAAGDLDSAGDAKDNPFAELARLKSGKET